jgi:hypothetical protein
MLVLDLVTLAGMAIAWSMGLLGNEGATAEQGLPPAVIIVLAMAAVVAGTLVMGVVLVTVGVPGGKPGGKSPKDDRGDAARPRPGDHDRPG